MLITVLRKMRPAQKEGEPLPDMVDPGTVMDVSQEEAERMVNSRIALLGDQSKKSED